jgi:hypothetical protein
MELYSTSSLVTIDPLQRDEKQAMPQLSPRKGMPSPRLSAAEFRARFLSQFRNPVFELLASALDQIAAAAWDAYDGHRKSPHTRKAGSEFADPNYELSVDWLAARAAIADAQRHGDRTRRDRPSCASQSWRAGPSVAFRTGGAWVLYVFIEPDGGASLGQHRCRRGLADLERIAPQIVAV